MWQYCAHAIRKKSAQPQNPQLPQIAQTPQTPQPPVVGIDEAPTEDEEPERPQVDINLVESNREEAVIAVGRDTIRFPRYFKPEFSRSSDDTYDSREIEYNKMVNEKLSTPNVKYIKCDTLIGGYTVTLELHPDSEKELSGWAKYKFSSKKRSFTIKARYNDPPISNLYNLDKEKSERYPVDASAKQFMLEVPRGKYYPVISDTDTIIDTQYGSFPFCLMDVDFDGDKEILMCVEGFNRKYFNPYKVVGKNAVPMTAHPFNNIVMGIGDTGGFTVFNRKNKTIKITESLGLSGYYTAIYKRKNNVGNILNPMKEVEYYRSDSWADGRLVEEHYINGRLSDACITFQVEGRHRYYLYGEYLPANNRGSLVLSKIRIEDLYGEIKQFSKSQLAPKLSKR